MMGFRFALASLLLCAALSGCGHSPTVSFLTLDPVSGPSVPLNGAPIQVTNVTIPPTLDRLEFVRHKGPDTLDIADTARWSAPLDALMRDTLSSDLQRRLAAGGVVPSGAPASPNTRKLAVDVQQFIGDEHGDVRLVANWTLRDPKGHVERSDNAELHAKAPDDSPNAIVAAMSGLLGTLADRIASQLGG